MFDSLKASPANRWMAAHPIKSGLIAVAFFVVLAALPSPADSYRFMLSDPTTTGSLVGLVAFGALFGSWVARIQIRRIDSRT